MTSLSYTWQLFLWSLICCS